MVPEWLKPKIGRDKIVYIAYPTRLKHLGPKLVGHVRERGFAPVDPFKCGDYEDFEGGVVRRKDTLWFTFGLQKLCMGGTWLYGISEGTMAEVKDRLLWDEGKNIRIFHGFDDRWDEMYEVFKPRYGDLLAQVRGPHKLIAFVGPPEVGKNYWMENLKKCYDDKLERIKNVTTKKPDKEGDEKNYYIVTRDQFEEGIQTCSFLEYDRDQGDYYGSSLEEIKKVLKFSNGMFAITPRGAAALYECRYEINVHIILLVFESEKEKQFLSPEIPYQKIVLTRSRKNEEEILKVINPILR